MVKRSKRFIKRSFSPKITFKNFWPSIKDNSIRKETRNETRDTYFYEIPKMQELLTEPNKITNKQIDYSNYTQLSASQINPNNLYDCFHGILFFIFYYSENKLNTEEIEFHFSGGKDRLDLTKTRKHSRTNFDIFDILNIFEYSNSKSQFKVNLVHNAFFGLTFKKVKINPIGYSIRSGENQNTIACLVSFTFEGFNEETGQWDVLDERVNLNDLVRGGSYKMFFTKTTNKFYSSFKIKQTEPGHNGFWGFSIAAFDVHGIVSLKDDSLKNVDLFNMQSESSSNFDSYNPFMDMMDFI